MPETEVSLRDGRRVRVRPWRPEDEPQVIDLWNETLYRDMISPERFRLMVILDGNLDPDGFLIAEDGGRLVGFLLALVRRQPMEGIGLQEDRGWITAMGIHPAYQRQGLGSSMLAMALDWFRARGRRRIDVSPYVPHYFMPGPDTEAYPGGVRLLEKHGFEVFSRCVAMSRKLYDFRTPPDVKAAEEQARAEGIRVEFMDPKYLSSLMEFLSRHFPGDWPRVIRERIQRRDPWDEILVCLDGEKVVGFTQFEGERFGPFGVAPEYRGKRLGTLLFYKAGERMKQKLRRHMWLAWSAGEPQRFYERHGLVIDRQHVLMKKEL